MNDFEALINDLPHTLKRASRWEKEKEKKPDTLDERLTELEKSYGLVDRDPELSEIERIVQEVEL